MIDALRQALAASGWLPPQATIEPLPDTGLAHWHLRLGDSGRLARVPKQSQLDLSATDHLAYEAACFSRAAASGRTPLLRAVLPVSPALPRGALIVDEVCGRPLRLPADLPALVASLAALHALPVPGQGNPLIDPPDPLQALHAEIERQALHLDAAALHPAARARIDQERSALARLLSIGSRPPRRLIAFDAHPGNFLVDEQGRAWLVDLEKARYGAAALDLAHATLYTSTTWDLASQAVLTEAQLVQAAEDWLQQLSDRGVDSAAERGWIAPLRAAMALWSLTWCAKWRVQSGRQRQAHAAGEDWSVALSERRLVDHVRDRVDHYLSPAVVALVFDGVQRLQRDLQT